MNIDQWPLVCTKNGERVCHQPPPEDHDPKPGDKVVAALKKWLETSHEELTNKFLNAMIAYHSQPVDIELVMKNKLRARNPKTQRASRRNRNK